MTGRGAEANDTCPWPQVILFDLDGTLIDSAPDIAAAVNEVLALESLGPLGLAAVRSMIGNGVRKLVERAFAACGLVLDDAGLDVRHRTMMDIYGNHLTNKTVLLPGAVDILSGYQKMGVKIGIVTNKPEAFTRTIVAHFGLSNHVEIIIGGDTCPTRKPDPGMLYHAAELAGFSVRDALMVGDSPADIDAAKAALMRSVAVRGGYTNIPVEELGADLVIDTLNELPAAIKGLREPV